MKRAWIVLAFLFLLLVQGQVHGQGVQGGISVQPIPPVPLSVTSTSSNVLLGNGTTLVVWNTGSKTAYYAYGGGSTQAALTTNTPIPPGVAITLNVPPATYFAAITAGSDTTILTFAQGYGFPALAWAPMSITVTPSGTQDINIKNVSGSPVSVTNPLFTAGAELPDATGTFTNATQTTSVTTTSMDGYGSAFVSINGTYGTASAVFEMSDDAGTTWYSVQGVRSDGSAAETGYASLTNTTRGWWVSVGAGDMLRVRSTAVATGTANIRISISSVANPNANPGILAALLAPIPAGTNVIGGVTLNAAPTVANGNGVVEAVTNEASAGTTTIATSALAANLVVNAAPTNLHSFNVSADSTLSAAAWWIMIHNATSAPADGAVTPAKCYAMPSGTTSYSAAWPHAIRLSTGAVIGVSTTGCFTKTASTHAFISGDYK